MFNNNDVLTLRFAFARAEPPIDASQDIADISASRMNEVTTVSFTRPRNSGDSNDISLDMCRFFLFAFGGSANFATQAVGYHFNNRFISSDRICIPTFAECSGKLACEEMRTKCVCQIHQFLPFCSSSTIDLTELQRCYRCQ